MRSLTLAECLAARGVVTRFICRTHEGHLIDTLRQRGMAVTALPAPVANMSSKREDYVEWLGVTQQEDARQTIAALRGERPDWLVVDHYGLGAEWERMLRPHAWRVMVIDDLPDRPHDCDLLLDQNEAGRSQADYKSRVPETCCLALGPRYALLRPEYGQHRAILRRRDGNVERVLVFFGGSDPANMTALALEALGAPPFTDLQVDVVVGPNNPHRAALERLAAGRRGTRLLGPQLHLAELTARADLAIGAGGATTWERMCLGVPSLVMSIAENQRPGCEALSRQGLIVYLGMAERVRIPDLRDALAKCISSPQWLVDLSSKGQSVVDGLGALRVSEYLDPTSPTALRLRQAEERDMQTYFAWVNDPEVRRQSVHSEPVTPEAHSAWFSARLAASGSQLFVLEARDLPVGQIRFDREADVARIDYSIDPLFRGRGWGKRLVEIGLQAAIEHGPRVFRADVKKSNSASASVFQRMGFRESAAEGGLRVFVKDCRINPPMDAPRCE